MILSLLLGSMWCSMKTLYVKQQSYAPSKGKNSEAFISTYGLSGMDMRSSCKAGERPAIDSFKLWKGGWGSTLPSLTKPLSVAGRDSGDHSRRRSWQGAVLTAPSFRPLSSRQSPTLAELEDTLLTVEGLSLAINDMKVSTDTRRHLRSLEGSTGT